MEIFYDEHLDNVYILFVEDDIYESQTLTDKISADVNKDGGVNWNRYIRFY